MAKYKVNEPTINHIGQEGQIGVIGESLHSSQIDGVHYIDVTKQVLEHETMDKWLYLNKVVGGLARERCKWMKRRTLGG